MTFNELVEILAKSGSKYKFLESIEHVNDLEKGIIPEHEEQLIKSFINHLEQSFTKLDQDEINLTEQLENILASVLDNNLYIDQCNNKNLLIVHNNNQLDLTKFPRNESRKILDNTVFRLHNIVREQLPAMLASNGKIIILNKYSGPFDAISYAIEGLMGTLHRELRNTQVTVSIINYSDEANKNAIVSRLKHCLTSDKPKFHYCVGVNTYISKLSVKILPEDTISNLFKE